MGRAARAVYPRAARTYTRSGRRSVRLSRLRAAALRPIEGDAAVAQRDVRVVADHQVVEQGDVEQPAGGQRLGGQVQVVGRRRRVAGRVVVDEDDAGGVEPDRVAEQLADAHQRRADVALVDRRDPQDVVLRVEHHDPQLLALEAAHLEDQAVGDVARDRGSSSGRPASRPAGAGPSSKAATSWAAFAGPMPGTAASSSSVARARPVSPSWRASASVGEVDRRPAARRRSPRPARSAPPRVRPADTAQGQPLARPLRRPAARGSPGRPAGGAERGPGAGRSGHRCTSDCDGGLGVPGARTTGARRFPPPSGPGDDAEPSRGPLTARLTRGFTPAVSAGARRSGWRGGPKAQVRRVVMSTPLNAACSPNDAQIVPRGRTASRAPARSGSARRTPTTASAKASAAASGDRQDVGDGEDQAARTTARERPDPRAQAVVANARNRISSPNGATTAPPRSDSEAPTVPVGGSGHSGDGGEAGKDQRDDDGHADDRHRPERAPERIRGDVAGPCADPHRRPASAPVSTTSRRISPT